MNRKNELTLYVNSFFVGLIIVHLKRNRYQEG